MNDQPGAEYCKRLKDAEGDVIGLWVANPNAATLSAQVENFGAAEGLPAEIIDAFRRGQYRVVPNAYDRNGGAFLMFGAFPAPGETKEMPDTVPPPEPRAGFVGAVVDFLFPRRLARFSYFLRLLLCNAVGFYLENDFSAEAIGDIAALIFVLLYMGIFVLMPRIRDIGMATGWIILAFIPFVSSFLGVALLFRRTNPRSNPLLRKTAPLPANGEGSHVP